MIQKFFLPFPDRPGSGKIPQFPGLEPVLISKMSQFPVPVNPGLERTTSAGRRVAPIESDKRQLMMIGPASYLPQKSVKSVISVISVESVESVESVKSVNAKMSTKALSTVLEEARRFVIFKPIFDNVLG